MKRYDYFWARIATQLTGIVFITQLLIEVAGAQRKPGFEWVVLACGGAFAVAVFYSLALIALNAISARNDG
jgi:Ni,Fe-hydrogenase I cytochrome b subunit